MSSTIVRPDLDELVFENREKRYGAYVLRQLYPKNVSRAFIIASLLVMFFIAIPLIKKIFEKEEDANLNTNKLTYAELKDPPPINKKEEIKPPPEELPPPPKRASIKFVVPEVVKDEEPPKEEQKLANMDSLIKGNPGLVDQEGSNDVPLDFGTDDGKGEVPVEIKEEPKKEEEPDVNAFVAVEKEPAPVNLDVIKKNIGYPNQAKELGIQGKVIIRVLVNKEGKPVKHVVVRSPHSLLTDAVVNQLYNLQFTPGIQAGKPISVWVNIPFDFRLQ